MISGGMSDQHDMLDPRECQIGAPGLSDKQDTESSPSDQHLPPRHR